MGDHPAARQEPASSARPEPLSLSRRGLHGRHADDRAGHPLRVHGHLRSQLSPRFRQPARAGAERRTDPAAPVPSAQSDAAGARATSPITTICRRTSTRCSSTATASIRAPISASRTAIWSRHRSTRSAISRRSSCSGPGSGCSTSAPAGAGSRSIWPRRVPPRWSASRCPRSSSGQPRARPAPGSPIASASSCATTASRPARSTASSRSACSSMSGSRTTRILRAVRDLLTDDGVALLHSIGRMDGPGTTNPWIRKYIFPGGYTPALSEVLPAVERPACGSPTSRSCACTTPRRCATGASASWPIGPGSPSSTTSASAGCGSSIWSAREMAFRRMGPDGLPDPARRRQDAVPLTRDYLIDWERGDLESAIAAE